MCILLQSVLLSGFQKQASLVFENQAPAFRLCDCLPLALMDDFFTTFNVDKGNFSITTYYPPEPPLKHLLNPFRKNDIPQVPEFTIGMLIASARAGRWLYD
ncbi:DUF1493 family protein [Salmonella enterica]|nr:DUF1493 family protein [Salmonella enterica]